MQINDSYWSGKENGQSEAEKFWKKGKKKTSVKGWKLVKLSRSMMFFRWILIHLNLSCPVAYTDI